MDDESGGRKQMGGWIVFILFFHSIVLFFLHIIFITLFHFENDVVMFTYMAPVCN